MPDKSDANDVSAIITEADRRYWFLRTLAHIETSRVLSTFVGRPNVPSVQREMRDAVHKVLVRMGLV
jgi:hypothetical protein